MLDLYHERFAVPNPKAAASMCPSYNSACVAAVITTVMVGMLAPPVAYCACMYQDSKETRRQKMATNPAYSHQNHLLTCWAGGTKNATLPTTRKGATLATAKIELLDVMVLWFRLRPARM